MDYDNLHERIEYLLERLEYHSIRERSGELDQTEYKEFVLLLPDRDQVRVSMIAVDNVYSEAVTLHAALDVLVLYGEI